MPMHASKRAFTLIELLVVIAIIAILAAILFPVFAQAKMAAKVSVSISNEKQILTAALTYANDFDDRAVLSQLYSDQPYNETSRPIENHYVTLWTSLLQPYTKNYDIYSDAAGPLWRTRTEAGWTRPQSQANEPGFGYNSTTFSFFNVADWPSNSHYNTLSMTAVANPADTVMFAASMVQYVDSRYGFYWILGSSVGWLSWGNVDSPACGSTFDRWCGQGWGNNYNWETLIEAQPKEENGYRSGAVSMRVGRQGIFGFSDGHVKRMPLSRAAAGTNWTPDISSTSVTVQDPSKYIWDDK